MAVILSEGESDTVEFKEVPDKSLPSEVCAFANASGGKVFIGVDDNGRIVGTDVSNSARSRVQDTINKLEPWLKVDIEVLDNIMVITVPEGKHKPYSCSQGFYLRSGPNSQKLERDSIIEFFQNEGRIRYDEIVREDLPITERFNETAYKRYLKAAKISDVLDRSAILKNLNCVGLAGGKPYFSNAGALFFRINDEDVMFRHAGIVCALYKGTDKAYILDAKELNEDIVSNVDNAMMFLKKHLRVSYKIETLQRENILELPEDALREAVVNSVCHRDYFEKGARVMVEIYDDRVDIVSPGGVCKGITRKNFGTISITRNSVIASMLYRIGYIEQMGTGIMRMKNAAREAKVAEPAFELSDFFKVTFKRNEAQSTAAIACQSIASDWQAIKTSDRKRAILSYIEEHSQTTSAEAADLLGLSKGRVRAIIQEMVGDGTIEKVGNNRYAYYVLKQKWGVHKP
ncbi:transcriptional regulator [Synergistales bacterium]|nr:transcriptional regulator [Synergistales bacterium]